MYYTCTCFANSVHIFLANTVCRKGLKCDLCSYETDQVNDMYRHLTHAHVLTLPAVKTRYRKTAPSSSPIPLSQATTRILFTTDLFPTR